MPEHLAPLRDTKGHCWMVCLWVYFLLLDSGVNILHGGAGNASSAAKLVSPAAAVTLSQKHRVGCSIMLLSTNVSHTLSPNWLSYNVWHMWMWKCLSAYLQVIPMCVWQGSTDTLDVRFIIFIEQVLLPFWCAQASNDEMVSWASHLSPRMLYVCMYERFIRHAVIENLQGMQIQNRGRLCWSEFSVVVIVVFITSSVPVALRRETYQIYKGVGKVWRTSPLTAFSSDMTGRDGSDREKLLGLSWLLHEVTRVFI